MADTEEEKILKVYIEMAYTLLKEYTWLLDSYVLDFFTENHLGKLSESWRSNLKNIPLHEFEYLMNLSPSTMYNVWPLSVMAIKALIQYLSLPRKSKEKNKNGFETFTNNNFDLTQYRSDFNFQESITFKNPKLYKLFFKHVKPKKRYEIFKMAETTAETASASGVTYVVDVGSGLGHLSRIMAYGFNLNVCSIETQSQLTQQAKKLDYEFEASAKKYLNEFELCILRRKRPAQLNQTIRSSLTPNEFLKNIKSALSIENENFKFGIVGLHPCGDLASTLLKIYTDCPEAKFINLVGCCYHKLSTFSEEQENTGFPLAEFCARKNIKISYEARALACHAIEAYSKRIKSKDYQHLKVHCYRAALEKIVDKNFPQLRKSPLGNVKSGPELNFKMYCEAALKKLNVAIPEEDFDSDETQKTLSQWQDVVKFYSLRLMIAPLIETVILLDRKLYLLEKGIPSKIIVAFDPEVSPRNHLLISKKPY